MVKQHFRFNMSTIRNVKKYIVAKLQSICFETTVISGTVLKMEIEHDSPPLRSRLYKMSSCQRVCHGKKGKNNFTVEKPIKHYLRQVIKVNNNKSS